MLIKDGRITTKINNIAIQLISAKSTNYTAMSQRDVKYIVVHYTGNEKKDTAVANGNFFKNNKIEASAHFFVDDNNIVQSVKLHNYAWSVGVDYSNGNAPYWSKCTNANSINIEMCCTAGNYKVSARTIKNTEYLVAYLCKKYNISVNNVVRHYDVCYKTCPAQMSGKNNKAWTAFKDAVKSIMKNKKVKLQSNAGLYKYSYKDPIGGSSKKLMTLKEGKTVQVLTDDGTGWVEVKVRNKVRNKVGWIATSHLGNACTHSSYKTITVAKGTRVRRLNKKETKFETDTKLGASHKFRFICTITSGKYKGCKYAKLISSDKNNGRMYYIY